MKLESVTRSLVLFIGLSLAGCSHFQVQPGPVPSPSPSITLDIAPGPIPSLLVTLGSTGSSVKVDVATKALALINEAYASGCFKAKVISHKFKSLHNIDGDQVVDAQAAYDRYVAGAPYALDLSWYYQRFSKTIGYTYNYKSGSNEVSETTIWTNTKYISGPAMLASHYTHELSHQARAGAFVHYTVFTGSFPYDAGDLMAQAIEECVTKK